jgi:hypothetical protein
MTAIQQQKEIDDLIKRVIHLEKILIIGEGDRLPLAEIVRSLTKTIDDYIRQKDKEEQERKNEWNKWKWLVIGIALPAAVTIFGQAIIFYIRVLPILETTIIK